MSRTFACSDLHGMYGLWKQIQNYLQEDDKLIFLGDAADRGPDGIHIMFELLADKRVTYLKGNHEDMMVQVYSEYLEGFTYNLPLWAQNGGSPTFKALQTYPDAKQLYLLSQLAKLPEAAEYQNKQGKKIFLSHAGAWMNHVISNNEKAMDLLWDRSHIYEEKSKDENLYIIHGHTPVQILVKKIGLTSYKNDSIIPYCEGHKIDIDLGCFVSRQIALLDLDTFEPIYFRLEEEYHATS